VPAKLLRISIVVKTKKTAENTKPAKAKRGPQPVDETNHLTRIRRMFVFKSVKFYVYFGA
jgi:hypothetical protein